MAAPNETVTLRQAQADDAATFRELRLQALRDHPTAFSADYTANLERPMSFWTDRLTTLGGDTMIYFAVSGDVLVGMCGLHWNTSPKANHSGLIWGVYVRPEWRGQRLAERLIDCCIEYGQAHGKTIFKLGVSANNAAAIRCYMRCGFQVYGVEPRAILWDGVAYDELLMARVDE